MTREEIEKLLGGYATGTLTEQERGALFEAALSDQGLFDALMNEQALADVLGDPRCRRQIVAALEEKPSLAARALGWLRGPQAWALAGSTAAVVVLALAVIRVGVPVRPQKAELALVVKDKQAPLAVEATPPPQQAENKPAEPKAPLRRLQPPPAREAHVAGEVPAPPELEAAARPPAPPQVLGQTAPLPAPPQTQADARLFLARPTAESADIAPQAAFRAAAPVAKSRMMAAVAGGRPMTGFGLRYSVARRLLNLEASQDGYLYVLGKRGLLFTTQAVAGQPYAFEIGAGETTLYVILSRRADPGPPDTLLARTRSQLERTPLLVQKADNATYVADPRGVAVLAEVPLK